MNYTNNPHNWNQILSNLEQEPKGTIFRIPKSWIDHPLDAGAYKSSGLPLGQQADYRWVLDDCRGLHARDFGTHYEAHIDQVEPSCNFVDHLRQDAPEAYVAGSSALGGVLGSLLGGTQASVLVGLGLGALFGLATLPEEQDD